MGLFSALKFSHDIASAGAKASYDRDSAAENANKAHVCFILLERAEADIAREASREPRLGSLLLALRNSVAAWKDSHLAYETAAKACQAVLDATRSPIDMMKMETANANQAASNALYLERRRACSRDQSEQ